MHRGVKNAVPLCFDAEASSKILNAENVSATQPCLHGKISGAHKPKSDSAAFSAWRQLSVPKRIGFFPFNDILYYTRFAPLCK